MEATVPEWLTPGAKVVVYTLGGVTRSENPKVTTIAKVAKKSFTVADVREPRFSIDRQDAHEGGTWGWTRKCVPRDSDEAHKVLERERIRSLTTRARVAVDEWLRRRTRDNRLAAIAALQAVEVDES